MVHRIYWKRPSDKKYKLLGLAFKDGNYAAAEAANMLRMGLDVKIKENNKIWFNSKKM
jgi:hypothetical protein